MNGPVDEVGCADCGHHIAVPDDMWIDRLQAFEREYPEPTGAGTVLRGDVTWRWTVEVVAGPSCVTCGFELAGDADAGEDCAGCGRHSPVAKVPAPLRRKVRTASRMFGAAEDLSRNEVHRDPVALSCPQCGGGLSIGQERARVTPCDFCGSQFHLPDAVWRQLHPPREVSPWVVRFDGEGVAAVRAREASERRAKSEKRKAERRAKKEAAANERAEKAMASQRAQEAREEAKRAQTDWRRRSGNLAVVLSSLLALLACAVMGVAIGMYFVPGLPGMLGLERSTVSLLNTGFLGVGVVAYLAAWLFGHLAVAWRAELPLVGTVLGSSLFLVLTAVPPIGMFMGPPLAWFYGLGRYPTPMDKKYKRFKHPAGVTWALALLLLVGGLFLTVAAAQLLGMSIAEMVERLPED